MLFSLCLIIEYEKHGYVVYLLPVVYLLALLLQGSKLIHILKKKYIIALSPLP